MCAVGRPHTKNAARNVHEPGATRKEGDEGAHSSVFVISIISFYLWSGCHVASDLTSDPEAGQKAAEDGRSSRGVPCPAPESCGGRGCRDLRRPGAPRVHRQAGYLHLQRHGRGGHGVPGARLPQTGAAYDEAKAAAAAAVAAAAKAVDHNLGHGYIDESLLVEQLRAMGGGLAPTASSAPPSHKWAAACAASAAAPSTSRATPAAEFAW